MRYRTVHEDFCIVCVDRVRMALPRGCESRPLCEPCWRSYSNAAWARPNLEALLIWAAARSRHYEERRWRATFKRRPTAAGGGREEGP